MNEKIYGSGQGGVICEKPAWRMGGFVGLFGALFSLIASVVLFARFTFISQQMAWYYVVNPIFLLIGSIALFVLGLTLLFGLVILPPNKAAVITFFGRYLGVIRENGIWLTVPFASSKKVSLRVRNFNSEKLKVNDVNGNPIEIAAVVMFRVVDAAKALLDVDNYEKFVEIQSETSLRHVAAQYPYDNFDEGGISLRGHSDEVSRQLLDELQQRLAIAGVEILEARLTHLAYATEIASAMLQRQQAAAILAARQIIVDGAVGMAQMAIANLEHDGTIDLDEERKINMINNLMVSIITDRSAQPIINVGSLY